MPCNVAFSATVSISSHFDAVALCQRRSSCDCTLAPQTTGQLASQKFKDLNQGILYSAFTIWGLGAESGAMRLNKVCANWTGGPARWWTRAVLIRSCMSSKVQGSLGPFYAFCN